MTVDRNRAMYRYLELRPVIRAHMTAVVPAELQKEFESVTPHQLRALVLLSDVGLTMNKLAQALGVTGATATILADRLVSQGLAARESDPSDRRVVRLVASDTGRKLARRYSMVQLRAAEKLFELLSDEQVAAIIDVMETLATASEAVLKP